ncbi:unnamed protein product [Effrenium voratum]|nr:unnamed protein product [Effrenium voratum]
MFLQDHPACGVWSRNIWGAMSEMARWLFLCCSLPCVAHKVAVVGAGINGGSAVHFLRQLTDDELVLYEAEREVGGRTYTQRFANVTVDVGGTAIYSKNRYMAGFAKSFGLQPSADDDLNSLIGIWDGQSMRTELNMDSMAMSALKLLFRYGLSPLRVIPVVREAVGHFDGIYDLQGAGQSFETPAELLRALRVFNLTQTSAYDFLAGLGVDDRFVRELVDGASRCNYNQPGTLNAFAELISLAGAGVGGHVFSLANGTQAVARGLARSASRQLLGERVTEVQESNGGYVVISEGKGGIRREQFDGVILATPLELTKIRLPASAKQLGRGREYQTTYTTFVHGMLNKTYFGLETSVAEIPSDIFTTESSTSPFSSYGVHKILADGSVVVKLFSRTQLTDEQLHALFPKVFEVYRYTWKAYPKLQPLPLEQWASFRLGRGLIYTSWLETSASAMEVAAIAGRNGALLMREALQGRRGEDRADRTVYA